MSGYPVFQIGQEISGFFWGPLKKTVTKKMSLSDLVQKKTQNLLVFFWAPVRFGIFFTNHPVEGIKRTPNCNGQVSKSLPCLLRVSFSVIFSFLSPNFRSLTMPTKRLREEIHGGSSGTEATRQRQPFTFFRNPHQRRSPNKITAKWKCLSFRLRARLECALFYLSVWGQNRKWAPLAENLLARLGRFSS